MGTEPLYGEIPQGFPPLGSTVDDGHGPQTSTGWDIGVPSHWEGAGNSGAGQCLGTPMSHPLMFGDHARHQLYYPVVETLEGFLHTGVQYPRLGPK